MASGSNVTLNVGANLNPTQLVRQLQQVQAQHGNFNMTLNTKGFRQPLGRITGDLGEFQNALDASIARTLAFGAAVGVVNAAANAFKSMVTSAIEVEKKLTDVNVILNESTKGLKNFSADLFEVAKNTGQSFEAVSDAAVELARQGLGAEETLKRINDAMILTRLSGMEATKSVEALTAAVNGFGDSALTTTQLVNKLATVDAAFAVSTEDLANALSRAGSSAQAAKVDLDQLLAAVTSVQQQTARGGSVIGNAFKSIFTRLQRSGVREALEEIGVATTDAAGNIRGALAILKDYAGVYKGLSDQQRAYTDELVAGVFQINNLKALVKDLGSGFSIYDRALTQSASATDEATRRNKVLGETLSSLVNEASVNVKALAASLGNLVTTPAIQNLLKVFNSISEAIVKALDPEKGSKLIQGMFKGIGAFIAGPGLLLVGAAFIKLFKFITGQSVRALKEVFKINTAAQKTKQIEAELSAILTNNTQLYQQISNQSLTRQQREQMVLNAINAETAAYKAQAVIVAQLARSRSVSAGVGARSRAGGGSSAGGFIPNLVNDVEGVVASERAAIGAGVGGASKGAEAKVLPGFPVGGGRKETMVANTDEVIAPNFGGGQGSAIFNPDMVKSMGMPEGAIPVASGFVPNFAKKEKDKGLKKIGATSSKNDISVDVSPYGVLFGFGPRGPKEKFKVNIAQQFSKEDLKSQQVSTNPRTNLLDYINYKTQGGSRIFLKGMPQGSLTPSGGADWESAEPAFRERYVAPAASAALKTMSKEIFKNVFDDEARDILDKIKIPAGAVSTSVEGGLFEQAINVGTSAMLGAKDFKGSGSERSRWDFDEDGMINEKLKNIFFPNDSRLKKADAKRSPEKGIWGNMASKVFSEERMKKKALSEMVDEAKKVLIPKTPAESTARRGRRGAHGFLPNFIRRKKSGKESKLRNRWVKAVMKGEDIGATMGLGRGGTESRATMPQLSKEAQKEFEEDLTQGTGIAGEQLDGKKVGIGTKKAKVAALRATQKDIYGDNVLSKLKGAFGAKWNKAGPSKLPGWLAAPIMISEEKRILDGHHRWATVYARDAIDDGKLGGLSMAANQIDLPIQTLLGLAETYSGAKQAGGATGAASGFIPNFAEKGLPESTAKAEKSAEKVKKEIFQLSLDWGDIVIGTKKLKKESSFDVVQPRGTTGIRGASGFIPSFAGALEESIAREKDALAAQGSSAKVYTGQDDRLKGPKNPGGLLVANTRDEPKSGSQGVDRMLSAGRNPKTGGSAEGYIPNFWLPVVAGAARMLGPLMNGLRAVGPAVARGGKAIGNYAKKLRKSGKAADAAGKATKTAGEKFQTLMLLTFGIESALTMVNGVLEELGYDTIPSVASMISSLMDSFRGIDREAVDAAKAFREEREGEIKALSQSIEKVDSFTGSMTKLSNAIDAGNVDSMVSFIDEVFDKAGEMEGIDIGSIFEALGDSKAMMEAAQAAKVMAQQAQGVKTLQHDLALLAETFEGMSESDRSLNKALDETEISMEGLSKSLLTGMNADELNKVVSTLGNMEMGALEALTRSFPNLSTEARSFISQIQSMSSTLAQATLEQAKNSLALSELKDKLKSLMGGRATISKFGSDLIKLGESIERGANSAAAALKTLNEVGAIKSKSRVENLKAAGTVGSEDLLKGLAEVDKARAQEQAVAEQKAILEKFASTILKSAEENATTLGGPLQTIVEGITDGTNTTEISTRLLRELNKETGESGKAAKAALGALQKINQTQISTQAKIQATLQANLEKLGRQAVLFQRNNILSEQQIKGFSEFRNNLQKDGETAKSQLQKLTDLKNVMTTIEKLTGDDAMLAEMKEHTRQLTQLEGLRSVFNELTGQDFKAKTLGGLEMEINDFVNRGGLKELDAQTRDLFAALKVAFKTAQEFGKPGAVGADAVRKAATVEINPASLNTMTEQMSEVMREGNDKLLGISRGLLSDLNQSLEKNVSDIAASVAKQATDNADGIAKNKAIQEEIARTMADGMKALAPALGGGATNLENNTKALREVTEALNKKFPTSAGGFVPNFAPTDPISRAANTERSLGGRPVVDYQKGVGTYVRDGKTQKNFSDVRRDHPEGMGRAMKNSRSMQGAGRGFVPNFAIFTTPTPHSASEFAFDSPELNIGSIPMPSWKKMIDDGLGTQKRGWSPLGKTYERQDPWSLFPKPVEVVYGNLLNNPQVKQVDQFRQAVDGLRSPASITEIWPNPTIKGVPAFTEALYGSEKTPSSILGVEQPHAKGLWDQAFSGPDTQVNGGTVTFDNLLRQPFEGTAGNYIYDSPITSEDAVPKWLEGLHGIRQQLWVNKEIGMVAGYDRIGGGMSDGKKVGPELFVPFQLPGEGGGVSLINKLLAEKSGDFYKAPNFEIPLSDQNKKDFELARRYHGVLSPVVSPAYLEAVGPQHVARALLAFEAKQHGARAAKGKAGYILPLGRGGPIPTEGGIEFSNDNTAWDLGGLEEYWDWAQKSIEGHEKMIAEEKKLDERRIVPGGQNAEGVRTLTKIPLLQGNISQLKKLKETLRNYKAQLFDLGKQDGGSLFTNVTTPSGYPADSNWDSVNIRHYDRGEFKHLDPYIDGSNDKNTAGVTSAPGFEHLFGDDFMNWDSPSFEPGADNIGTQVPDAVTQRMGEIRGKMEDEINYVTGEEGYPKLADLVADSKTWSTSGGERAPIDMSWIEPGGFSTIKSLETRKEEVAEIIKHMGLPPGTEEGGPLPPIPPPITVERKLDAGEIVRDNIYRSLLNVPLELTQGAGSRTMSKRAIERARKYKNDIWPARKKANQKLLTALYNEEARGGDAMSPADQQKLNAKIEKAEKKKEIFEDEHEALAYLYSGGGDPKGDKYDTADSSYRKMLNRYFNGKSISDGDSIIAEVAGEKLNSKEYLKQYYPQLDLQMATSLWETGKHHGTGKRDSILRDYAQLRGLGEHARGLDGAAITRQMDNLINQRGPAVVSSEGRIQVGGSALDVLLRQFGGKQIADLVRADDGDSKLMNPEERQHAINSLRTAVGGRKSPALDFALGQLLRKPDSIITPEATEFMKFFTGTNKGFDFTAGIPAWDFSELAGAKLDITRVADMQSWKVPAAPAGDRSALAFLSRNKLMKKYESTKKLAKKRAEGSGTNLVDRLVAGVSKEELHGFAPYLASLNEEERGTSLKKMMKDGPEEAGKWELKYGSKGDRFNRLIEYMQGPKPIVGEKDGYKLYHANEDLSTDRDLAGQGTAIVGSIDQGLNKKIQKLLETGGENPYSGPLRKLLDAGGISQLWAEDNSVSDDGSISQYLRTLRKPVWAPLGYFKDKARLSPSGSPDDVETWLNQFKETLRNPIEFDEDEDPSISLPPAARGFVPNFSAIAGEIAASRTAGYKSPVTAGQVKSMNIPGVGKTAYNTQESVFRKPGVSQPFIAPPSNSKAASGYRKAVQSKFNFDPYGGAASGFVPNFAGMDLSFLTKGFDKIFDAAELFSQQSRSMKEAAKLIKDGAEDLASNQKASFTPLTAATSDLNESMRDLATNMPSSVEVETGTLGESMDTLAASLGSVSGSIGLDVKIPNINVNVAGATSGAITENLKTTLNAEIPKIIAAEIRSDSIKQEIEAIAREAIGLK